MKEYKNKILIAFAIAFVGLAGLVLVQSDANTVETDFNFEEVEAVSYYDPNCGCCAEHINYMKRVGVDVDAVKIEDTIEIKEEHGIPEYMYSCHTTIIDGYVIEGHMPLDAVAHLLEDQPDIKGIALPGMPSGSPGMPGPKSEPFTIYELSDEYDGAPDVYLEI